MGYIRWLGHAAFEVELDGKILYFDPWITNPLSPVKLNEITKADLILVTHGHFDHTGESAEISKKTGAPVIAIYEVAEELSRKGAKTIGMNIGGTVTVKELKIVMVPAYHSSPWGSPVGFIVIGKETSIYHAGDTGVFYDMKLIGELYSPKIALLPIGSHYTMGPYEAAKAIELLQPEIVIPMHYGTFDVIKRDPSELIREVEKRKLKVKIVPLKPGEKYTF
ncbi:MAG TPA: metal-dependent hydrolase [Desulfurococcales archaeon]|nr:metal-dependent hydrolase [Desulfurococcales archaeon]